LSERIADAESAVKAAKEAEAKEKDADKKKEATKARQTAEEDLRNYKTFRDKSATNKARRPGKFHSLSSKSINGKRNKLMPSTPISC
jgi:hypothetical protein